jgi:hypothetical protein
VTDRRDAVMPARYIRLESCTIYVSNQNDQALRNLVRTREDAVEVTREAKQRLKAFVLLSVASRKCIDTERNDPQVPLYACL